MKLEYLNEIDDADLCPEMICLSSFNGHEIQQLINLLDEIENGKRSSLSTNDFDFIAESNCELEFKKTNENRGVYRIGESKFQCALTQQGFYEMRMMLRPFIENWCG